jgi:NAD(P) transhydrogenase subunit alpha
MRGFHNGNIYIAGFVLLLSIFLGLELIAKVPSTLHTPLMSGANAISGIALVGALMLSSAGQMQDILAFGAILFASINVFGGYLVTNRMLSMFKKK